MEDIRRTYPDAQEVLFPMDKVHKISLLVLAVFIILFVVPFHIIWMDEMLISYKNYFEYLGNAQFIHLLQGFIQKLIYLIIILFLSIILHEGLHGVGFFVFSKAGLKEIQFGILWKYLAPYAHCTIPITRGAYMASALLPVWIMALCPLIISFFNGSIYWLLYGIVLSWASTGDVISVWLALKIPSEKLLLDHHEHLGFFVVHT